MASRNRILLLLFATALGLRILYSVVLGAQTGVAANLITSDLNYAREIVSGPGWITEPYSPRSPGYPAVLGSFYLLSGKQLWLVKFWQAMLGALTVVFTYRLGRLFLGRTLAVIAALWFAFHVYHMHLSTIFYRDILVGFLLVLLLFYLVRPFAKMRFAPIAGLVFAILFHVDPQYVLLLPVFVLIILFKSRHGLINAQYLFLFLSLFIVASTPWTLRNLSVYGQPIPVGLEALRYLRPAKAVVTEPGRGLSDLEQKVVRASRSDLIQTNMVEFWRFARFRADVPPGMTAEDPASEAFIVPAWSLRHNLLSILNIGLVIPFFLLGIVIAVVNRNRVGLMLSLVIVAFFFMRAYLGANERIRVPVDPLIILIAFYGVMSIVGRFVTSNASAAEETG
jgi:4-amino-4-deoxy-L-arabinose transferase-like glycosyltransferase